MHRFLIALLLLTLSTAADAQEPSGGLAVSDGADFCQGPLGMDDFRSALRTTAQNIEFTENAGAHPMEKDINLVTAPTGATSQDRVGRPLYYRVWVAERNVAKPVRDMPRELDIREVVFTPGDAQTTVRAGLRSGAEVPLWQGWRRFMRVFFIDISLLLVGCDPENGDLVYSATGHRTVTTFWAGVGAVGVAAVLFAAILTVYQNFAAKRREARAINDAKAAGAKPPRTDDRPKQEPEGAADWFKSIFLDFRGAVSLSYFQVFLFMVAVFFTFAVVLGRTFQLSDLSEDILLLLGISAVSGVVGKTVDIRKQRLDWVNWAWLNFDLLAFEQKNRIRPHWGQLVSSNGSFDVYRFQALCFSVLVALAIFLLATYNLDEFTLPDGVLALLGISQVTYVVGKFAAAPTIEDFDKRVTQMRTLWEAGGPIDAEDAKGFAGEFEAALGMQAGPDMVDRLQSPPKPAAADTDTDIA